MSAILSISCVLSFVLLRCVEILWTHSVFFVGLLPCFVSICKERRTSFMQKIFYYIINVNVIV